jgi:O-antigen/teichoic acid export membrane protein
VGLISVIRGRLAGRILLLAGATVLQVLLSIILLPISTSVLGASDFGRYALLMSVAGFANVIGDGGGALALPAHYGVVSADDRRSMLASFFLVSLLLSSFVASCLAIFLPAVAPAILGHGAEGLSEAMILMAAVLIPLRSISTMAVVTFSVSGRGVAIAMQIVAQAGGTFCGTLIFLFWLKCGAESLFAGAVVGQFAAVLLSAIALGAQPWSRPNARWLAVIGVHAPTAAFAGAVDGVRSMGENTLIAANVDVATLGIFSHARLYYGMLLSATNSVANNIWSTSLDEARDGKSGFEKTHSVWVFTYILVTLFGVGFACIGREFVSLLTNDRLTGAAELVPWFVVLLLINISGRPQNAIVYAHGCGPRLVRGRALISLVVLAALPWIIGKVAGIGLGFGAWGAIGAIVAEAAIFRIYLVRMAMHLDKVSAFEGRWTAAGIAVVLCLWTLNEIFEMTLLVRGFLMIAVTALILAVGWRRLSGVLKQIQVALSLGRSRPRAT